MDPLSVVRRRLVEQGLAGEPFASPADAVRWLGAVQAQEFAEVKWSLAERLDGATDADVEAAFTRGDIVRTHVLRPTWHFAARDDVRWLLRLTRPRVHALNRYWYRKFELDAETFARSQSVFARVLADGVPRTRVELTADLAAAGIEAASLRLGYLFMHAELEELLVSGPRRGKQQTYALLDDRVPTTPHDDRPLDELALRYFRSHGPATAADFAAWASFTLTDTRAALDRLGDELAREEDEHGTPWFAARDARVERPDAPRAFLVPMYDETVVAYQDLRVVLAHPQPQPGLLDRAMVVDGRTVGSWRRTLAKRSVAVETTLFGPLSPPETAALEAAVERFGASLGLGATLRATIAT